MNNLIKNDNCLKCTLPIACTLAATTCCLVGIFLLVNTQYFLAFGFVLLAVWLDMMDGYFARLLQQESVFGATLDLLQDVLNYLVFPSLLFYQLGYQDGFNIALLFIFVMCGLLRLARFHADGFLQKNHSIYYVGMPVYYNHLLVLIVLLAPTVMQPIVLSGLLLIASLLMVSSFPFKKPRNVLLWSIVLLSLSTYFLLV